MVHFKLAGCLQYHYLLNQHGGCMRKHHLFYLIVIAAVMNTPLQAVEFRLGVGAGYTAGFGYQLQVEAVRFTTNAPVSARFGLEYSLPDPGNSGAARKIFINNATNGIPEKFGRMWNFRFDILLPVSVGFLPNSRVYFGPRYADFLANFKYVGGNEDFDVTSEQWGLGAGIETRLPLSDKIGVQIVAGLDHYFTEQLNGHDTSYTPQNDNINPRENYKYKDADSAVNQPKLEVRFQFGLTYML